jgi:WD40 repeat protein/TPR repeat protein
MAQRLRIFVSSPGDVMAAREVAAQVIEKLAHEYVRFFAIEPYLWEYEPMLASGHFQDSIDPPSSFDVVVLILESRLGTPLPERTAVREYRGIDGRTPVTGTEWEFEDALAAAREHGVPDLLVYRSHRDAGVSTWDAQRRKAAFAQLEALDMFWSRHFGDEGRFIGAYAKFEALEEFAGKLEQHLRRCVQRRIEALRPEERTKSARLWPTAPFRGLEAYEFQHAPIFFGREEAIGAALLRLVTNARDGRPFLLVLGASGSGKSSLVKAGVLPRLLVPQRVSGVAFLRRVVFRPGDSRMQEDLFDALARCLTQGDGESTGLPELRGSSMQMADLARHLRESSANPDLPFAMVLDRLAETARKRGQMLQYEQPRLILELDQLEELFTSERVQAEERKRFVQLLAALVHSRLVWVIATMRADFWHRAAETPELLHLADGGGRLDVSPPVSSELSQMIRGPAEAAAIQFEINSATGIPLNDLIAQEAAGEPGTLPLLSYLLGQLYRKDIQETAGDTLTYGSYAVLGGLRGAIATRADAVVAAQASDVRAALRQVLFALVQISAAEGSVERAVARRAPISHFPEGTPKRRLIDALLDPSARLVIADAPEGKAGSVRLAHEALISEWQTARNYVASNAEALRSRRMLEERCARWLSIVSQRAAATRLEPRSSRITALSSYFGQEHGLLTDVDLTDAKRLLRDYREELSPELVSYIQRSIGQERRRHRRSVRAAAAIAAGMSVLAAGAGYEARLASAREQLTREAQRRSLTQTAAARLKESDLAGSTGIILEVLRAGRDEPQYPADAVNVFQELRAADAQVVAVMVSGHTRTVESAVFSVDGRRIAAAVDDTVCIWQAEGGPPLLVLRGHTDKVESVSLSPDGRRVVSASRDKTARIWDADSGQPLLVLTGHADSVMSARYSPDGRHVVTGSADKSVRVWNAMSGQQLLKLDGHTEAVRSAAFSPNGGRIVSASEDRTARTWDAKNGRQLLVLSGHTDQVQSAAYSPDGRLIVTASLDNSARVWDAEDGVQLLILSGHSEALHSAAFSADGDRIVTASDDKTARVWDAQSGQQLLVLSGPSDLVVSAAFSPDARHIVAASLDRTVRVWDVAGRQLVVLRGHAKLVTSAAFSPDGKRIVTGSFDKTARVWDARNGQQLLVLEGHTQSVRGVALSPDGRHILTASRDRTARVWDATSGQQILVLNGHSGTVTSAAYSPNGRRIVTASQDRTARVWDADTGRQLLVLSGHTDVVESAAFSPDGRYIVTASLDRTARIWNAESGEQLVLLNGHSEVVVGAAFSPDGQRVITASFDKTARIWDARSGRQLLELNGHSNRVDGVAFSPDGLRVATASDDNTARIWDAQTGQQLVVLSGHTDVVERAVFSPDGRHILTASDDKTARIWEADTLPLQVQLTWAEGAQFEALSSRERFQLGLSSTTDVHGSGPDESRCDQVAAAPYDPDRRSQGVFLENIATGMLATCSSDRNPPDRDGRLSYQHGRVLMAKGDFAGAERDFERAIKNHYRAAEIDLGILLSSPATGMLDVQRSISLFEQAWRDGALIAAFELGNLYEHGVRQSANGNGYLLAPDAARSAPWYQKGAQSGEPTALGYLAQLEDRTALSSRDSGERSAHLLQAFRYYASAAERARLENWPDDAWRNWRYRRASIARLLAREGMMQEVAGEYDAVRTQYKPPSAWRRLASLVGGE